MPSCCTATSRPTPPFLWKSSSTGAASGRVSGCGRQSGTAPGEEPLRGLSFTQPHRVGMTPCGQMVCWFHGSRGPWHGTRYLAVSDRSTHPIVLSVFKRGAPGLSVQNQEPQPPGPLARLCSLHLFYEVGFTCHRPHCGTLVDGTRVPPGVSVLFPLCQSQGLALSGSSRATTTDLLCEQAQPDPSSLLTPGVPWTLDKAMGPQ